ncbi:predicted protein [Sclerotinia sclerotiorum 1980 UF-70]|uniref:Uncharacterized protein n=1 Tax=Sclerotinia sclerotiorum (strain ATCC 18683 / 1980 / Ss-1) TaxID=665079 RepID=A7EAE8_SCLS1|nr:predicted protein [Sclerotinia sclerotiorum 1980 UF-70]EDN99426.1 predicted protein [Sclerotinia sclerotiorum 1980 UF-70]
MQLAWLVELNRYRYRIPRDFGIFWDRKKHLAPENMIYPKPQASRGYQNKKATAQSLIHQHVTPAYPVSDTNYLL